MASSTASTMVTPDTDTLQFRMKYLYDNYPDNRAFVFATSKYRQVLTYREVYQLAARFSKMLINQGFKKDDVIANTLPNCPERVVTDLGIMFSGCIPINGQVVQRTGEDFFHNAKITNCRAVVVWANEERNTNWNVFSHHLIDPTPGKLFTRMSCSLAETLTTAILINRDDSAPGCPLMHELGISNDDGYVCDMKPDDIIYVFTTSGSTGFSKMVAWTSRKMLKLPFSGNMEKLLHNIGLGIKVNIDRPLGWIGGFPFPTYTIGVTGLILDLIHDFKDPKEKTQITWEFIQESTQPPIVLPQGFYQILEQVGEIEPDERIEQILTGSQPIMKHVLADMLKIAKKVKVHYASTESGIAAVKIISDAEQFEDFCMGKPIVEHVRIVNKDMGDCEPGKPGIIWLKGSTICSSYFNLLNPDDARPVKDFPVDGWFNTNDSGYLDEEGQLYVIGRQGDVIIHGSHEVYPGWLNRKIAAHPDVREVVCVGVSDPVMFNEICACAIPEPGVVLTPERLRRISQEILLDDEHAHMPKYFLVYDEFPSTATGKIEKSAIKTEAEQKFGIAP